MKAVAKNLDANKGEIIAMYVNNGKTMNVIAKKYNCSAEAIRQRLKKWGIKSRKRGMGRNSVVTALKEHKKEIIELYVDGQQSAKDVASVYDVSGTTIIKFLKENGVDVRKQGSYNKGPRRRRVVSKAPEVPNNFRVFVRNSSFEAMNTIDVVQKLNSMGIKIGMNTVLAVLKMERVDAQMKFGFWIEDISKKKELRDVLLEIFKLYEMPVEEYKNALEKHYTEVYVPQRKKNDAIAKVKELIKSTDLTQEDILHLFQ